MEAGKAPRLFLAMSHCVDDGETAVVEGKLKTRRASLSVDS